MAAMSLLPQPLVSLVSSESALKSCMVCTAAWTIKITVVEDCLPAPKTTSSRTRIRRRAHPVRPTRESLP